MTPTWCRQVNWRNCGIPWVNCAVLCVKDDWKWHFWSLHYCLSNLRSLFSFFPSSTTSHSKIAHFNCECIGRFTIYKRIHFAANTMWISWLQFTRIILWPLTQNVITVLKPSFRFCLCCFCWCCLLKVVIEVGHVVWMLDLKSNYAKCLDAGLTMKLKFL